MRSDFSLDTIFNYKVAKPRFELITDSSSRAREHSVPARGRSAHYAREFSFARCHDEAGAIMIHSSAAGNTPRIERSTSPGA